MRADGCSICQPISLYWRWALAETPTRFISRTIGRTARLTKREKRRYDGSYQELATAVSPTWCVSNWLGLDTTPSSNLFPRPQGALWKRSGRSLRRYHQKTVWR